MSVERTQQRIGDAERELAVALLGEHVGAGRLDIAEFESRSGRVYAARTRSDLDAVFADLPRVRRADPERSARVHRTVLTAVWTPWVVSSVVCLAIWLAVAVAQGGPGYFWPIWVIAPWGAVLALGTVTGGRVCGSRHTRHPV